MKKNISLYLGHYELEGLSKGLKIIGASVKGLVFIDKHEPVTSTHCSDGPRERDSLPCDSAIRVLFQGGS